MRGFDVSHWYKGSNKSFFSAYHHMATTRPMLRLFAPKVQLNNLLTTLDEATLGVQAHIAVLLKFLLIHDNFDVKSLLNADGRIVLNMDHVFNRLKTRYPDHAADIDTTIVPGFTKVLTRKHSKARDFIKTIHQLFDGKEPAADVS